MTQSDPRFHVPAPHARPGDTPDFSHIEIPPAGEARKPAVDIDGSETRDLALGLVRVLDHNHQAVGEWDPKLDADVLREGLKHMVLIIVHCMRLLQPRVVRAAELLHGLPKAVTEIVARVFGEHGQLDDVVHCQYDSSAGLGDPFPNYMGALMGCVLSPDRAISCCLTRCWWRLAEWRGVYAYGALTRRSLTACGSR